MFQMTSEIKTAKIFTQIRYIERRHLEHCEDAERVMVLSTYNVNIYTDENGSAEAVS